MNSERPIEKMLRAFARQRREQAGQGFELHPATRRMLQGEVTRQYGQSGGKPVAGWKSWARFWPRLAFASATLAVLIVTAVILIHPEQKPARMLSLAKSEAQSPAVVRAPVPNPPAAPMPVRQAGRPADEPAAAQSWLADSKPAAPPSPVLTRAEPLQVSVTEPPSASSPAPAHALAMADKAESLERVLKTPMPSGAPPPTLALPPPVTIAPSTDERSAVLAVAAKDALTADSPAEAKESEPTLSFAARRAEATPSADQPSGVLTRKALTKPDSRAKTGDIQADGTIAWAAYQSTQKQKLANQSDAAKRAPQRSDAAQAVLNSFHLELRGSEIRIVDADGSVYTGTVQLAEMQHRYGLPMAKQTTTSGLRAPKAQASAYGGAKPTETPPPAAPAQELNVTVRGTNTTLRQAVEFVGFLQPVSTIPQLTPSNQAKALSGFYQNQALSQRQAQSQLLNSRLTGRVRLANGEEVEINAVPLTVDAGGSRK